MTFSVSVMKKQSKNMVAKEKTASPKRRAKKQKTAEKSEYLSASAAKTARCADANFHSVRAGTLWEFSAKP